MERIRHSNRDKQSILDHGCWVIGDSEFVKNALKADAEKRLRLPLHSQLGWDLDKVAQLVTRGLSLQPQDILKRGRGNARAHARKVFAFVARRELGFSLSEIGGFLGVSNTAAVRSLEDGERQAKTRKVSIVD